MKERTSVIASPLSFIHAFFIEVGVCPNGNGGLSPCRAGVCRSFGWPGTPDVIVRAPDLDMVVADRRARPPPPLSTGRQARGEMRCDDGDGGGGVAPGINSGAIN